MGAVSDVDHAWDMCAPWTHNLKLQCDSVGAGGCVDTHHSCCRLADCISGRANEGTKTRQRHSYGRADRILQQLSLHCTTCAHRIVCSCLLIDV